MKSSERFWHLVVAGLLAVVWGMVQSAQGYFYTCTTNWCEVVRGPSGWIAYTNIVLWPESPMCLGGYVCAWPEADWRCSEVITVSVWSPPSTNCPPAYSTNTSCPYFVTNWWVVSSPGYSDSGSGSWVCFYPTNCGGGTITFYGTWRNWDPCTGEPIGGGTISISKNFKVVNVDIVETEKTICVCDTTSYTLTNSCDPVTWEVVTNGVPGEPYASGSSIIAGTNCGSWTVIARSTINTNCTDSATLTVVRVEDLFPDGGTLISTNPPTYTICPVPTYSPEPYLTVTATPCPWMEETNLPACWQMSGGIGTSRVFRKVDRRQLGTTTITATAGCSSKTAVIIVQDTNPPAIYCWDLYYCNDNGNCSAQVYLEDAVSAWDDCGEVSVTFSPGSGTFDVGEYNITATAKDMAGNTATCSFNVFVYDCENPTITCSTNIIVCASLSGTNIVTWPTPSASDNCAVTNIACSPPSGSDFPPGETTVTCTATDSSGNVGYCTFTVTVVKMDVTNIKFNHNTSSSSSDAINIREDYSTPYDISNGEWIEGGANLPVCYTTSKAVTIKVRLTVQPAGVTSADVWAVSTDSNGSLGAVAKGTVTFSGGVSSPEYVTFNVSGNTPTTVKRTTSDVWQWKAENINGSGSSACDLNSSGPHTVYTILNEPAAPWNNTAGSLLNVWSRVLEKSCSWADGAANGTQVVGSVVTTSYNMGVVYDGAQHYTYPGYTQFHLQDLLDDLDAAGADYMDCRDFANWTHTLTGSLGIAAQYRVVDRTTSPFYFTYNYILPAGHSNWGTDNWNFHQVGWWNSHVGDASLKLDNDSDPTQGPGNLNHVEKLAVGDMTQANYLDKLTETPDVTDIQTGTCIPQ